MIMGKDGESEKKDNDVHQPKNREFKRKTKSKGIYHGTTPESA